jgi:hypothetical protein
MNVDLGKKDLAELCMFISAGLEATDNVKVEWRVIKKFVDDFLEDNGGKTF